jgi:uncharacterized RDD family membrane protein YckC
MARSNSSYVITPDAFSVSPSLVGLPLARPARRLAAMLLDLAIVALLVRSGGAVLLGLAAAWFTFRMAGKLTGTAARPVGRLVRLSVRAVGALILFIVATSLWSRGSGAVQGMMKQGMQLSVGGGDDSVRMNAVQALGMARQVSALQAVGNEDDARRLSTELVAGLRRSGMEDSDVRSTMRGIVEGAREDRQGWLGGIVEAAIAPEAAPAAAAPAANPDSLAGAYAAAVEAGDTAAARVLRPQVASALARDSLEALRGELRESEVRREEVSGELDRIRDRGFLRSLMHFLDELGIGFGWTGLYFTAFVALWKGQTPGKRLLGVRVVRLDGKPMTMWSAFERFGGYAAGLVTGLLGFAQVYWDRNRQMIHDKIVETVVVRERVGASVVPAPAPASGSAPAPFPAYPRRMDLPR